MGVEIIAVLFSDTAILKSVRNCSRGVLISFVIVLSSTHRFREFSAISVFLLGIHGNDSHLERVSVAVENCICEVKCTSAITIKVVLGQQNFQ